VSTESIVLAARLLQLGHGIYSRPARSEDGELELLVWGVGKRDLQLSNPVNLRIRQSEDGDYWVDTSGSSISPASQGGKGLAEAVAQIVLQHEEGKE
jgi:hypothetical protein